MPAADAGPTRPDSLMNHYDVVIVGARAAGSPLATHLAETGAKVCLIDRAEFPSDTLSTHTIHGIAPLQQLGVLDDLLRTGAPLLTRSDVRVDDIDLSADHAEDPSLCVRRHLLDQALAERAVRAGAELRTATGVTALITHRDRVQGVVAEHDGRQENLSADLVVGADGRNSTVARLVGAARYNVTRSERPYYWAYYTGATAETTLYFHRSAGDMLMGIPADSGLFLGVSAPPADRSEAYKRNLPAALREDLTSDPALAAVLGDARQDGPAHKMMRFSGYFRQAAGPGWVLVGDSGHFKDPTVGQGINDALRQARQLSSEVLTGLDRGRLDTHLARFWRWRDAGASAMYWFAQDMGRAGAVSPVTAQLLRQLSTGHSHELRDLLTRRREPAKTLSGARLLTATVRLLAGPARGLAVQEAHGLVALDRARRRVERRPHYEGARPTIPSPRPPGGDRRRDSRAAQLALQPGPTPD